MSVRCIVDVRRLPSAVTSVLVASETFAGTAAGWPSQWVALAADGTASRVSGQGQLVASGWGFRAIRMALANLNLKNVGLYAEFTPKTLEVAYLDVSVRQDLTRKGSFPDGYFVSMDTGGSVWTLGKIDSDAGQSSNTDKTVTWTATPWAVYLTAVENVITAKVWKVSDGEGSAQTQTLTDGTYNRSGSIALGYNSSDNANPGVLWGNVKVWDLGNTTTTPVTPTTPTTTYSYDFSAASQLNAFSIAKGMYGQAAYPTVAPTISGGKLVLSSGSGVGWQGGASIFLGDPTRPEGNATVNAPPISSNFTAAFNQSFLNLTQQYPTFFFRARGADLWTGGDDANTPRNGGYALVFQPLENKIILQQNYNAAVLATIPFTFPSKDLKAKVVADRQRLSFKFWNALSAEPTAWTYDVDGIITDESDGSIGWSVFNGVANETKTLTISGLTYSIPVLSLGTTRTTPPAEPAGFTRVQTEDFTTTAAAGTAAGQFMSVYAGSFQPYDDGGTIGAGAMYPRQMISAHDGVMDVSSDGQRASAGTFGSAANAYGWRGGRFSIRMKTIGMFNNGPAFMLWPTSEAWVEGEVDFPESVSGRGGNIGFQDAPYIHQHTMDTSHPNDQSAAQDVPLGVSWRDWHTYTVEWYIPGKAPTPYAANQGLLIYYVDGGEKYRTVVDVPTTAHRWCFQIGDWGTPGNIYIDWFTTATKN